MVSSNPPILKRTRLTVVAPWISVLDEREAAVTEKFYKGCSTIEPTCRVERMVGRRPEYIIWHHEDCMLNYDTEHGMSNRNDWSEEFDLGMEYGKKITYIKKGESKIKTNKEGRRKFPILCNVSFCRNFCM